MVLVNSDISIYDVAKIIISSSFSVRCYSISPIYFLDFKKGKFMMEEKSDDILDKPTIEYNLNMSKKEKEDEMRDILMSHYGLI